MQGRYLATEATASTAIPGTTEDPALSLIDFADIKEFSKATPGWFVREAVYGTFGINGPLVSCTEVVFNSNPFLTKGARSIRIAWMRFLDRALAHLFVRQSLNKL